MGFVVEETVEIGRSVDEVFSFMSSDDTWRKPYVRSVRALSDDQVGVGSRFENRIRVAGVPSRAVNEITILEPPVRLSWRQVDGTGLVSTVEGNYLIEPTEAGARVTVRNRYDLVGLGKLIGPMVRILTTRVIRRMLAQLSEALS